MVAAGWRKSPYDQSDKSLSERKQHQLDGRTTKAPRIKSKWVKLNLCVWRTSTVPHTIAKLHERLFTNVQIYPRIMYNVMSHPSDVAVRLWLAVTVDIKGIWKINYHWHSSLVFAILTFYATSHLLVMYVVFLFVMK